jgi:hypothetical protein
LVSEQGKKQAAGWGFGLRAEKQNAQHIVRCTGRFTEAPATAYSPAVSRPEYHRRCRA